jgi:glycosyltransferase involved in cell wall biosynthesis
MISITIATFNRCELLDKILKSLSNQGVGSDLFEVVICDSNSNDDTSKIVSNHKNENILDIKHYHTDNILAAKRNLGINKSNFDFVVFLDDDCVPDDSFVKDYLNVVQNEDVSSSCFCGKVVYPDSWVLESNYYRFRNQNHTNSNNSEFLTYQTIVVMNMGFSKRVFMERVGYVNEEFIGYGCEDQEFGYRIEEAGIKIKTCNARIYHYENTSTIEGYMKKMHRVGRDGMKTLIQVNPEAAWSLSATRLLEENYPNKNFYNVIQGKIIRFFLSISWLTKLIQLFCDKSDGIPFLYSRTLYRYLMASSYLKGCRDRNKSLEKEKSHRGWYED